LTQDLRAVAGNIEASTRQTHEQLESQLGHTDLLVILQRSALLVNVFKLPQTADVAKPPVVTAVGLESISAERNVRLRGAARG